MIKQMDEMVSGLADARRRTRRIMRYWDRTIERVIVAITMPIWVIPYLLWRRRMDRKEEHAMALQSAQARAASRNTY